ncbi:hypothetical protein NBG4_150030 [Candidatus Sulfobium mesophilum]|uniref:Prepilin-type N-terminal cleavage/methylation domain-containing protein n=1 Tax=Candidatus Sulfobium mesophilum TaxID=2016548 RepID=A0A2U3QFD9_9BACT|nr:hypothetical protein NBG4_150030 [Candidatus Sulfobium mesophilum]
MNKRGMTLIELLIVVAIIGILASIGIPAYIGQKKKAARAEAYTNLQNLSLLEAQFFADQGRYTANLGAAGNTIAIRDANLTAIQTTAGEALGGFRPGAGAQFSYRVIQDVRLPNAPVPAPFNPANVIAQNPAAVPPDPPCFVATATGIAGTRVANDLFAMDCFNNKNF